jgi:hypothetical protein
LYANRAKQKIGGLAIKGGRWILKKASVNVTKRRGKEDDGKRERECVCEMERTKGHGYVERGAQWGL